MNDLRWRLSLLRSQWTLRLRYACAWPFVYRHCWRVAQAKWGHKTVVIELRNGLKYRIRPGTTDLGVINEAVVLNPYLGPGYLSLPRNAIVVDIGANIGDFALQCARLCPEGTVYAVEPILEHCEIIREQITLNGVGNVHVLRFAMGESDGEEVQISVAGGKSSLYENVGPPETVTMTTLGALLSSNGIREIDLLKMDCEGAEWQIFPQAEPLLPRIRQICMEYHNGERTGSWFESWLAERGYNVRRSPGEQWNGALWAWRS